MKRAFLIHGWEGRPEGAWRPWLKRELEEKGFSVTVPEMPDTNHPKREAWVGHLARVVGMPDKDCYFVGHSLGCITILRYLEGLKEGQRVGGTVLVAGFTDNLGYKELAGFFSTGIDWKKINTVCKSFVAIHSDNDPYVPMKHGDVFNKELGAEVVVEHNKKHFGEEDGIMELPSALYSMLKMSK